METNNSAEIREHIRIESPKYKKLMIYFIYNSYLVLI